MQVTVRFFAALQEAVGRRELAFDIEPGATVEHLLELLSGEYPRLGPLCQAAVPSVNHEYSSHTTELHDGDEIVFIPPVSGGRDV